MNTEQLRDLADKIAKALRADKAAPTPKGYRVIMSEHFADANIGREEWSVVWSTISSLLGGRPKKRRKKAEVTTSAKQWFVDDGSEIDYTAIPFEKSIEVEITNQISAATLRYVHKDGTLVLLDEHDVEVPRHVLDRARAIARTQLALA